ncbi:hypothetical protein [Pedobacter duraquae]|uniref:Uncharacterized protein n=1 Tax=Pedobacter duraquae TaxID=425511 RepID=A0A4R6IGP4_9SPHI|nr:hypothetical protein [Pedobacter duraquae]TDO21332.1 hypothetical protein CLV32_2437 [Pedobacter duraquae]
MINRDFIFYWLRWTLLLPLSIAVGLLASSVIGFILSFVVSEAPLERYKHALNPFITSFLSLVVARWIAPRYKSKATLVICVIWLVLILLCLFISVTDIRLYGDSYELKDGGMAVVMIILGMSSAYLLIWKGLLSVKIER